MPVNRSAVSVNRWNEAERESVADLAGHVASSAILEAGELLERAISLEIEPRAARALAGAAKDAAIVAGILVDKAELLSGRPTTRAERVDTAELRSRLGRLLGLESLEVPRPLELEP